MNTAKKGIRQIVKICALKGVKYAVISPGSRNAPLITAFTNEKSIQCVSIVDERCAGFFALGIAQQEKAPVVLLCTSGSAVLNYAPAIAEATPKTAPSPAANNSACGPNTKGPNNAAPIEKAAMLAPTPNAHGNLGYLE